MRRRVPSTVRVRGSLAKLAAVSVVAVVAVDRFWVPKHEGT